ncbi:multicomponent Na+:H+ antiporter subunit E/energy-converting hydrogenase B subunit A [Breznakibacter xylanolyticus]|uniref:Multicomponent Na+:H+ antiporter subunit E/energy-converting hydrogenase B subunit A n=1 Tax=Breznakibacter xylanolyticus TaxID=990 RepID=A0A2W7NA00_9BACT|nr:Na+/H+ antiporter subunit E [Breznakibacter xylanolyticus]PZX17255.1 multicomponent Na+:H+ antiporter subunit E/energy-converting hydrogenase B subunit A [Breznakibacter xylanolyticus]
MKPLYFIVFWFYYLYELLKSGVSLAFTIVVRSRRIWDGEITYHTTLTKPIQVVLLFNLVSMTPGTLSIDIDEDNNMLIHVVDLAQLSDAIASIKRIEGFIAKMV